jgi:Rrf2 family protein
MRISKKAYYGLRAAAALARNGGELSVHELAHTEDMPEDYLHKILQSLRKASLVTAAKGQGGGYALARDTRTFPFGMSSLPSIVASKISLRQN